MPESLALKATCGGAYGSSTMADFFPGEQLVYTGMQDAQVKEVLLGLRSQILELKKMNTFLQAENSELRHQLLFQGDRYVDSDEVSMEYGPRLAADFSFLIDKNKYLKTRLQQTLRGEARCRALNETNARSLAAVLQQNFRQQLAANKLGLAAAPCKSPYASGTERMAAIAEEREDNSARKCEPFAQTLTGNKLALAKQPSLRGGKELRVQAAAEQHCQCTEKLQELLDTLDENLKSYERGVWQLQTNVLEDERNELSLKVAFLQERLAELQSRISTNPFTAAATDGSGLTVAGGFPEGCNGVIESDLRMRLAVAEQLNAELERRLAFEKNISRSWQTNLRCLQRELRDHLSDLATASRTSGLRCTLFRGGLQHAKMAAAAAAQLGVLSNSEKESLRLLRQARDRIQADAIRMESFASRIAELTGEVNDLRWWWPSPEPPSLCSCCGASPLHGDGNAANAVHCCSSSSGRSWSSLHKQSQPHLLNTKKVWCEKNMLTTTRNERARNCVEERTTLLRPDFLNSDAVKIVVTEESDKAGALLLAWQLLADRIACTQNLLEIQKRRKQLSTTMLLLQQQKERQEQQSNVLLFSHHHDTHQQQQEAQKKRLKSLPEDPLVVESLVSEAAESADAWSTTTTAKKRAHTKTATTAGAAQAAQVVLPVPTTRAAEARKKKTTTEDQKEPQQRLFLSSIVEKGSHHQNLVPFSPVCSSSKYWEESEDVKQLDKQKAIVDTGKKGGRKKLDGGGKHVVEEEILNKYTKNTSSSCSSNKRESSSRLRIIEGGSTPASASASILLRERSLEKLQMEEDEKTQQEKERRRRYLLQTQQQQQQKVEKNSLRRGLSQQSASSTRSAENGVVEVRPAMAAADAGRGGLLKSAAAAATREEKEEEEEEEEGGEEGGAALTTKTSRPLQQDALQQGGGHPPRDDETGGGGRRGSGGGGGGYGGAVFVAGAGRVQEAASLQQSHLLEEREQDRSVDSCAGEEDAVEVLAEDDVKSDEKRSASLRSASNARKSERKRQQQQQQEAQVVDENFFSESGGSGPLTVEVLDSESPPQTQQKPRLFLHVEEQQVNSATTDPQEETRPPAEAATAPDTGYITSARRVSGAFLFEATQMTEAEHIREDLLLVRKQEFDAAAADDATQCSLLGTEKKVQVPEQLHWQEEEHLQQKQKPRKEALKLEEAQQQQLLPAKEESQEQVTNSSMKDSLSEGVAAAVSTVQTAQPLNAGGSVSKWRHAAQGIRNIGRFERLARSKRPQTLGRPSLASFRKMTKQDDETAAAAAVVAEVEATPQAGVSLQLDGEPQTEQVGENEDEDDEDSSDEEEEEETDHQRRVQAEEELSPRSSFKLKVYDRVDSLASAFKHMDKNANGTVTVHEFADFLDECGLDYPFSVVHQLYMDVSQPANVLTVSMLYRNVEGNCSLPELGKRIEDIWGSVEIPFSGKRTMGRVSRAEFLAVAGKSGLTSSHAEKLWESVDVLKGGSLQKESLLLLLEDNVSLSEVKRVEQQVLENNSSGAHNFAAFFSGAQRKRSLAAARPVPRFARKQSIIKPLLLQRKLEMGFTEAEAAVDDVLETTEPWDVFSPDSRLRLIRKLQKKTFAPGEKFQPAHDPDCPMYVLTHGTVQLLQPGILMETVEATKESPCLLFSEDLLKHKVNNSAAAAEDDVTVYILDRNVFQAHFETLLVQRMRKVEEFQRLLKTVPVLSRLEKTAARRLARSFEEVDFAEGDLIIREFDEADSFYLVVDGQAAVVKYVKKNKTAADVSEVEDVEEEELRIYQKSEYFGELSLLKGHTRTATIKAKTACTVLSLSKEDFDAQLRKFEREFTRRAVRMYTAQGHVEAVKGRSSDKSRKKSTSGKRRGTSSKKAAAAKSGPQRSYSAAAEADDSKFTFSLAREEALAQDECMLVLDTVPVLRELPLERRKILAKHMIYEYFPMHTPILIEGEDPYAFYVLKSGTVSAERFLGAGRPLQKLMDYSSGVYFGEMSLINNVPVESYFLAQTRVEAYKLRKEIFENLLGDVFPQFREQALQRLQEELLFSTALQQGAIDKTEQRLQQQQTYRKAAKVDLEEILKVLKKVPIIHDLPEKQLKTLSTAFTVESYQGREVVIQEGAAADKFYIIYEGDVSVQKAEGDAHKEVVVLHEGEYLGEIAFLNEQPRTASCVAKTDVKLLALSRADFNKYLSASADAFVQYASSKYGAEQEQQMPAWLQDLGAQGAFFYERGNQTKSGHKEEPSEAVDEEAEARTGFVKLQRKGDFFRDEQEEAGMQEQKDALQEATLRKGIDAEKEAYKKKKERRVTGSSSQERKGSATKTGVAAAGSTAVGTSSIPTAATTTAATAVRAAAGKTAGEAIGPRVVDGPGDVAAVHSDSEDERAQMRQTEGQGKHRERDSKGKRRMSLAGSTAAVAAQTASFSTEQAPDATGGAEEKQKKKKKEKKTEGDGIAEETLADTPPAASEGKEEAWKGTDKKKKRSSKEKASDRRDSASLEQVKEIRDLVRGTLKNKYGSIAQAFHQIDANTSDMVDFEEFYSFLKALHVRSLRKRDVELLYDDLCKPLVGRLTVANLYRNIDERGDLSKAEVNLRWVEIFGSSAKAFKTVAGLNPQDACSTENFIDVAAAAGVTQQNAMAIWKDFDRAERGSMHTKIICAFMTGELTAEEAEAREETENSVAQRFWNLFAGGGDAADDGATSQIASHGEEQLIENCLKYEDMAIVQRDDHRAFPASVKRLAELLEQQEAFCYLQQSQLRYITSLMKRETVPKNSRVLVEGEEAIMIWCVAGKFKMLQTGFFGEREVGELNLEDFFGLHELVNDLPLPSTLLAEEDNSALWVLEKEIFQDLAKDMLETRKAVVPIFQNFLSTVPIVKDMTAQEILRVARACKVERFAAQKTVFRAGMPGDIFCFIFEGEIKMLKPQAGGRGEAIELGSLTKGNYFGEVAVIKNQRRTASVVASTDLTLLCLEKEAFEKVLGRVKGKMIERAESLYKRQDVTASAEVALPSTVDSGGVASASAEMAGDAPADTALPDSEFTKKRTRKSSLALVAYSRIRDQEKGGAGKTTGGGKDSKSVSTDSTGEDSESTRARWVMAEDPLVIHQPPKMTAVPRKPILRRGDSASTSRRKNAVLFDESTLLPSPPSSEDDAGSA